MADKKKSTPQQEPPPPPSGEINNPDFQFVLKALLAVYQPILEEQLNLAKSPEDLEKQAQQKPLNAKEEFRQASLFFEKFLTEDVALRMIPNETVCDLIGPTGVEIRLM